MMRKPVTFDFTLKPKKPNGLFMGILKLFAAYPEMKKRKFSCEYVNMEGVEPPYFLLANHASEMDFRILYAAIRPLNMNYVVAIDAMHDNGTTQCAYIPRRATHSTARQVIYRPLSAKWQNF